MNIEIHFLKILKKKKKQETNSGKMSFKVGYWFIRQIIQNKVKTYQTSNDH